MSLDSGISLNWLNNSHLMLLSSVCPTHVSCLSHPCVLSVPSMCPVCPLLNQKMGGTFFLWLLFLHLFKSSLSLSLSSLSPSPPCSSSAGLLQRGDAWRHGRLERLLASWSGERKMGRRFARWVNRTFVLVPTLPIAFASLYVRLHGSRYERRCRAAHLCNVGGQVQRQGASAAGGKNRREKKKPFHARLSQFEIREGTAATISTGEN